MLFDKIRIDSPNVTYTEDYIFSRYRYDRTRVHEESGTLHVIPEKIDYELRTEVRIPRLGVMLVGWGGSNGTTMTAGIIANRKKLTWRNGKKGLLHANYYGSMTQSSTIRLGDNHTGEQYYCQFSKLLPTVHPNDFVLGGWDICNRNLKQSMEETKVLDYDLQQQLADDMEQMIPLPGIFDPDFVAENQAERANNVVQAATKSTQVDQIRQDLRNFKAENRVDKIVVLWTANTERFSKEIHEINGTAENLLAAIERNESEISPSTLYAVACILEGVCFINGSPQNTFVDGVIELAERENVMIAGDDFKSGQTKMKSVLIDFLVNAGIKPVSIASYNHLGNNDGKNLADSRCFRSKEVSKTNVIKDMIVSNEILYKNGEEPDHCVVIKYLPYVGDSKRALDEYISEIFLNGENTITMHNTCEDSLLASPLIIDMILISELTQRIMIREIGFEEAEKENQHCLQNKSNQFRSLNPVNALLSYWTKAPLVQKNTPLINSLSRQRAMVENFFRACVGLPPDNSMYLEYK